MTTTCADVVARAIGLSVANQGLIDTANSADVQDALVRISQMQAKAFTTFTASNKTAFLTTVTKGSIPGNGGRIVDLSTVTPRVQRIVRVTLAGGTEVALVDPAIPTSEMAPRYFTEGETVVEVSNDWDQATTNAVSLTFLYASRPPDLDMSATATLAQAVGIPDRYTDVLVYDLGAYLAEKDVGRDDQEVADLLAKRDQSLAQWVTSAAQFGGVPAYTFDVPTPNPGQKD